MNVYLETDKKVLKTKIPPEKERIFFEPLF
jgi:hypothetical protein